RNSYAFNRIALLRILDRDRRVVSFLLIPNEKRIPGIPTTKIPLTRINHFGPVAKPSHNQNRLHERRIVEVVEAKVQTEHFRLTRLTEIHSRDHLSYVPTSIKRR